MAKNFQKYFIAIVPKGEVQDKVTAVKVRLKEKFNLKYSLNSPAHITLKMPFIWNEAKEERLLSLLRSFLIKEGPFRLAIGGLGNFGKKVIYLKVREQENLNLLQKNLGLMCKTRLNLIAELSDYAYHPHMTLAYKDTKERLFDEYLNFLKGMTPSFYIDVNEIALLKRDKGRWLVHEQFSLKEGEI